MALYCVSLYSKHLQYPFMVSELQSHMASLSSSSTNLSLSTPHATPTLPSAHHFLTLKVTTNNYWKTQVAPFLRGQKSMGFVDGTIPCPPTQLAADGDSSSQQNPAYDAWVCQDQMVMSLLIGSLSDDVFPLVVGLSQHLRPNGTLSRRRWHLPPIRVCYSFTCNCSNSSKRTNLCPHFFIGLNPFLMNLLLPAIHYPPLISISMFSRAFVPNLRTLLPLLQPVLILCLSPNCMPFSSVMSLWMLIHLPLPWQFPQLLLISPQWLIWVLVKRILRYLCHSLNLGLLISRSSLLNLQALLDSDWAGCTNGRRSTGGYAIYLENDLVSWSLRKQRTVALS